MGSMMKGMTTQAYVGIIIAVVGGALIGGETILVKWLPVHRQRVREETLSLLPYRNDALGIEMQVAEGFYGEIEGFPGGVRIGRSEFWRIGPSLTITSQPNPDQTAEFSPQVVAKWEIEGVNEQLPRYYFSQTKINSRDAVLIRQYKNRAMLLTARLISPERIIEVNCTSGSEDEDLYMEACEESVRTIKLAGPEPLPPPPPGVIEMIPSQAAPSHR